MMYTEFSRVAFLRVDWKFAGGFRCDVCSISFQRVLTYRCYVCNYDVCGKCFGPEPEFFRLGELVAIVKQVCEKFNYSTPLDFCYALALIPPTTPPLAARIRGPAAGIQ